MRQYIVRRAGERLRSPAAVSELIASIFVLCALFLALSSFLSLWGQMVKLDDLQQAAQSMAREISLSGRVDQNIYRRLEELEQIMGMELDMTVEGDYIGSTQKLRLESDFTVIIRYKTKYGVGWIDWGREKTYEARAIGTAEEYHK